MFAALFGRDWYPLVAKVYVYVDGFNLYYGALKRTPYKWLDLAALCRLMLPNDSIEHIKYYTARVFTTQARQSTSRFICAHCGPFRT
jgi:hypothetical protein